MLHCNSFPCASIYTSCSFTEKKLATSIVTEQKLNQKMQKNVFRLGWFYSQSWSLVHHNPCSQKYCSSDLQDSCLQDRYIDWQIPTRIFPVLCVDLCYRIWQSVWEMRLYGVVAWSYFYFPSGVITTLWCKRDSHVLTYKGCVMLEGWSCFLLTRGVWCERDGHIFTYKGCVIITL